MKTNWDKRFVELARHIAGWSKDRNTQVGAVIVDDDNTILSVGYNGFPRGMDDDVDSRHERPAKYLYTEHAERNAIFNAVRSGVPLKGAKIYLPWFPCTDCARAIINSGIKTVVATEPNFELEKWGELFKVSYEMFEESGVKVKWYGDKDDGFWDLIPKTSIQELEWDITGWTTFEPSAWLQHDWNQTLLTKINQCNAMIVKGNHRSDANMIRIPSNLLWLFESLEIFDKETFKLGKFDVVIWDELANNEILVYYNGIHGRSDEVDVEKEKNFATIKITNLEKCHI